MPYQPEHAVSHLRELAEHANAWPFAEARALLKHLKGKTPEKGYVLFETGYGPSGLPHIGTFGEVARTSMVRHAFTLISDIPTKLFAYSDDMDGLRKVPDNVPNKELMEPHLGKPLTQVPDPFGTHESFAHHNNARLQAFLDDFGFEYEFKSATDEYKAGRLDATLLKVLQNYDDVIKVILPTLGAERQATYSPFLPVCPETGIVLQVPVIERNVEAGTIVYQREDGQKIETLVTGGACKLQWKADWAMRWAALDVDYEMSGKDLIDSVKLSSRICRAIGGTPPLNLTYELFLDENGEKISKSKGNGLSVEDWLRYAPQESLSLFMFQKPKTAKRLFFDVIPKAVDEYLTFVTKYPEQEPKDQLNSPAWHIHNGQPPEPETQLNFNILLNLASVCNTEDKSVLWHFISRYRPDASPETAPTLDSLVGYAINYFQDFVKPNKVYRAATEQEKKALGDLKTKLEALPKDSDGGDIQSEVFAAGKENDYENLREWFGACYETLLGQSQGPRMGSFFVLYGLDESIALIERVINGEDLNA